MGIKAIQLGRRGALPLPRPHAIPTNQLWDSVHPFWAVFHCFSITKKGMHDTYLHTHTHTHTHTYYIIYYTYMLYTSLWSRWNDGSHTWKHTQMALCTSLFQRHELSYFSQIGRWTYHQQRWWQNFKIWKNGNTATMNKISISYLVGGLEHFLLFFILGIIIPTD